MLLPHNTLLLHNVPRTSEESICCTYKHALLYFGCSFMCSAVLAVYWYILVSDESSIWTNCTRTSQSSIF